MIKKSMVVLAVLLLLGSCQLDPKDKTIPFNGFFNNPEKRTVLFFIDSSERNDFSLDYIDVLVIEEDKTYGGYWPISPDVLRNLSFDKHGFLEVNFQIVLSQIQTMPSEKMLSDHTFFHSDFPDKKEYDDATSVEYSYRTEKPEKHDDLWSVLLEFGAELEVMLGKNFPIDDINWEKAFIKINISRPKHEKENRKEISMGLISAMDDFFLDIINGGGYKMIDPRYVVE